MGHRGTKERIRELALGHASFGYRRITAVLRRQGWRVNPKRVYRLYRQMDLQRPTRRKGRRGVKRPVTFMPTEAQAPGQVWAIDFIEDKLVSGRRLSILNVLDLCSRYALDSLVEHSLTGELAARHLERLFLSHGAPGCCGGTRDQSLSPECLRSCCGPGGSRTNRCPKANPLTTATWKALMVPCGTSCWMLSCFIPWERLRPRWQGGCTGTTVSGPTRVWGTELPVSGGRQPPLRGLRLVMDLRPLRGGWGCQAMPVNLNPLIKRVSLLGASHRLG